MSLLLEKPEIEELLQKLTARTGERAEDAVQFALRERLDKVESEDLDERLAAIHEIIDRVAAMPVLDARDPDEILGYNEHGYFD